MTTVAVIGMQWGDEGKGKIIDLLAPHAHCVVRFQGGNNAGHTLVINGEKTILHLVPSGIMHPRCLCLIADGVVIDPQVLADEIEGLQLNKFLSGPKRLAVSENCHLILPYHIRIDQLREERKTEAIGTTGRGIGPCFEDRVARQGIRMKEFINPDLFRHCLEQILPEKNAYIERVLGGGPFDFEEIFKKLARFAEFLASYVRPTQEILQRELELGHKILFEGAQGVGLDLTHGTYPYVTSCHTVAGAVATGAGISPKKIDHILGVCKAYATRVGFGPFPTELHDDVGAHLQRRGDEFGATTGRKRRTGWLDLAWLKKAVDLSGCDSLAITKLDVLSGLKEAKVAFGYESDGTPIYETLKGWSEPLENVSNESDFPEAARDYIRKIEDFVGVPISILSLGAERSAYIIRQLPF